MFDLKPTWLDYSKPQTSCDDRSFSNLKRKRTPLARLKDLPWPQVGSISLPSQTTAVKEPTKIKPALVRKKHAPLAMNCDANPLTTG